MLHFAAFDTVSSVKTSISVSDPEVNRSCTYTSSLDGFVTISGSCERALTPGTAAQSAPAGIISISPNPFNPSTILRYHLDRDLHVRIRLYDLSGREIRILENSVQKAGDYVVLIDGSTLASGTYLVSFDTGSTPQIQGISLVK